MKRLLLFLVFVGLNADNVNEGSISAKKILNNIKFDRIDDFRYENLPKKYSFLPSLIEEINSKKPILTISYLTSSSVPISSHLSFDRSINKLKKEFNIESNMCMIGIEGKVFSSFILNVMERLGEQESELSMGFCPELFEELTVTEVPVYVISVCPTDMSHPEECKNKYFIRGDISLKFALEKLYEKNKYFEDMYEYL